MNSKIWLSSPHMGENEAKYIQEAFDTNWIAPLGPHVDAFEKALCAYTGVKNAAALSSGTAALHLALILLGVSQGDEVLCQSFTFSASANPIAYQGATPIFVDSERETWNMCPVALEEAIKDRLKKNRKPKVVIVVHLYGMPAQMTALQAVCEKYEIPLIEDAAEALGSTYQGQPMGSFGKLGILSFNGNKIITTSGGGALLGNDEALIAKSRFLATQARDPAPHYQHSHIGYNYRLSNVCAGIGLGQMEVLPTRIEQRRSNFNFYQEQFKDYPFIQFQPELFGSFSNRWLSALVVDDSAGISREDMRLALEAQNIEARPLWKPLHRQPVFSEAPCYGGTVCEDLFNRGLCLPSGSNLNEEDLTRVVETIKTLF